MKKTIKIDENKCIGCGTCANACKQKVIEIINGKAKLIRQDYCDGLGICLPVCPVNAISFMEEQKSQIHTASQQQHSHQCHSSDPKTLTKETDCRNNSSQLLQWPTQIKLIPVNAPYFSNASVLIAADCTAYTYGNFHNDFMKDKITLIGCPKLDNTDYSEKFIEILKNNNIKEIHIARMEVPCCSGIVAMLQKAVENSGKNIPLKITVISIKGDILN